MWKIFIIVIMLLVIVLKYIIQCLLQTTLRIFTSPRISLILLISFFVMDSNLVHQCGIHIIVYDVMSVYDAVIKQMEAI